MSKTDIGIDLGTANTVITLGKKGVVLSEPSAIAYHTHTKEVLAVGKRAYQMIGKIVSTMVAFLWNFFARKYLLFSKKEA